MTPDVPQRAPSRLRLAMILAIALFGATVPTVVRARDYPVSTPASSPVEPARQSFEDEDWARKRADEIEAALRDPQALRRVNVLFVGDSITQFWLTNGQEIWRRTFAETSSSYRGLDLGFSGDRTENTLLHLLERSAGGDGYLDDPSLDPEVIFLMIGVNNTWKTDGPVVENVVAGNIAIIARLRQLRPRATLYVQSVLPAADREHNETYIIPINRSLQQLIKGFGPKVRWLDLYPLFTAPDGSPSPELFGDTVHPTARGYEIWSAEVMKILGTM